MDISEEMEEVRELLYELIKKSFPRGVASTHLAEKYNEEWVFVPIFPPPETISMATINFFVKYFL